MKKITEIIQSNGPSTYSFEVTPDISVEELKMLPVKPHFFSVTWHASTHHCKDMDIAPLRLAKTLKNDNNVVLLHITCDMMKTNYLIELLFLLQNEDICNLFVLLGENYDAAKSDFKSAQEMIKFIRQQHGDYFCIGVASFPESTDDDLRRLKTKVDSGANFLVTQAFFEAEIYKKYLNRCEQFGIKVPIIPGIFPFETEQQLQGFIKLCKVKVSNNFMVFVQSQKAENKSGEDIICNLIKDLRDHCNHFHFFTVNRLKTTVSLVKKLNL